MLDYNDIKYLNYYDVKYNTNYYDIESTEYYYNNQLFYKIKITHKYLKEPSFLIEATTKIELLESLKKYIIIYDEKFSKKYNNDLKKIYNSIFKSKIKLINWGILRNNKLLYWERQSQFITYSIIGKPEGYSYINDNQKHTWKPRLLPFSKKDKIFFENEKRFLEYKKEETNWELDYSNEVNRIKTNYYNYESNTIVRYCRIVFIELEFHPRVKEILNTNNLRLDFNKEKKNLNITLVLPSKDDSKYLLQDKIYIKNQNEYKVMYSSEKETTKRLELIWKQIILVYINALFKNDEINAINSIYFNGITLNTIKYEMIIEKTKLYKKDSMQFNFKHIDDFISTHSRDAVLLRKLRLEKVAPSDIKKNNDKNIISLIITQQKLSKKAIEYITSFKYLKELYLVENELMRIPRSILNLSQLEVLRIAHNEINEIPFCLENLNRLHTLKLDHNLIDNIDKKLLECFLEMPTLKTFSLNNNPLIDEDMSYLEKDDLISKLLVVPHKVSKEKKILKTKIPLIITEGKTDWKHLEKALERFKERGEYLDLDIQFEKLENISMSDSELDHYARTHAKEENPQKLICIFDRDLSDRVKEYGQSEFVHVKNKQFMNTIKGKFKKEYGENSKKYLELEKKLDSFQYEEIDKEFRAILTGNEYGEWEIQLKNNVYAFCIPKLSDELDEICIEFYYKEKDLKKEDADGKRLFTADEFEFKKKVNNCNRFISKCGKYKTDTQSGNDKSTKHVTLQYPNKNDYGYVYKIEEKECNKSNNMNLSKDDFAKNIINDVKGFDNFDIKNFELIFNVIKNIVK